MFVTSAIAGRVSAHVSTRLLIGPGFLLIGAGLLLMRGITPASGWTHLLPGMIVAGVGAGLVNVPLASTAVGVVHPSRSGMASGVNSTLRQVGIAAGIAGLGSVFASQIRSGLAGALVHTPLAPASHRIAAALAGGRVSSAVARVPASARHTVAAAGQHAFVSSLDDLLLISGVVAFAGALLAFALIRQKDFVESTSSAGELVPAAA